MVEKNDQKKCRDISTEIQEILAKWGKYFFYYYPKEHRIRPSEFAARHMGIVENATDLEHSILMDRIRSLWVGFRAVHRNNRNMYWV